jgi:putative transposase
VPQDAVCGTLWTAYLAWQRCFKKIARKPRLKGRRNRLNSIPFAHGTTIKHGRVLVPYLGYVRFHKQAVPEGHISQLRVVKRASGWYACLFVKADTEPIPRTADGQIGADPGFTSLLTLSTGEKIDHPRELEASALRLAQAQRGGNKKLAARIQERISNRRKDRNHKLSRRLVSENTFIAFSKDRIKAVKRRFGKSVTSSGHNQLRSMISYKASRTGDTIYVEPESRYSTQMCSGCGALSGPTGLGALKVRQWRCDCGSLHDRDVNAALNTLHAALGGSVERLIAV